MLHIDLKGVLHRTHALRYGDLVTRHTGQAVRSCVEQDIADLDGQHVAVIDFSSVRCLDFSCADEIVGKLLLAHGKTRYFMLRGVTESHSEAIDVVLERYGLAVLAQQRDGSVEVLGPVSETVRAAVRVLSENGTACVEEMAGHLAIPGDNARATLDEILSLRLALISAADGRVMSLA